ncbi:MAG TPA: TonB-dependent receptor [Cyclobacteriaceae bacterium]|jgi:TonB-linked SusC/RagA family outer membrane protein
MTGRLLIAVLFAVLFHPQVWAQDRQVSGRVTSQDDGTPVPGVNVVVEGTTRGTTTDVNGNYTIQLGPNENTLVFSFVGFKPAVIQVDSRSVIDVALESDITSLDEVVVIGYGEQRERDLTSSITTVTTEEIVKTPTAQAMQALQGKVAGLQIVSNGSPGDAPTVRLRGIGSYIQGTGTEEIDTEPLYVVDGMFFDNIDFLNTADIKSISVLKDASAAAIFGVRASNGVVLIETKSGNYNQAAQISYSGYYGVQRAQNVLKMANAEQFTAMANESGVPGEALNILNAMQRYGRSRVNPNVPDVNTDWYKEVLRVAPIQNHSLDISGGSDRATYLVGGSYFGQEGILDMKNDYERFNLRTRVDYRANDWLNIGANLNLSNAQKNSPDNAVWNQTYYAVPIMPVIDEQNVNAFPERWANAQDLGYRAGQNPFPTMRYNTDFMRIRKILSNFYAEIQIIPDKLSFKSTYNAAYTFLNQREVDLPYFIGDNFNRNVATINKKDETWVNQIWDNVLTYTNSFGLHNVTGMLGTSFRDESFQMLRARGTDLVSTDIKAWYLSNARNIDVNQVKDDGLRQYGISYFARIAYNFNDRYLVYGTIRADGSNKYQQTWGYFPSVGLGWVVSEEPFMEGVGGIDFLKLRASWGQLGNDKIPASDGANTTQTINTAFNDTMFTGTKTTNTFSFLEWELTEETNFGLTSELLGSRLSVEADYFIRDTKNAAIIFDPPLGQDDVLRPQGVIRNSGFELALNWQDELANGLTYSIGVNMATLKNEVRDLYGQPYLNHGQAEFRQRSYVGEPIYSFYGWEVVGVYQNNEEIQADPIALANNLEPGDFKYRDRNNDNVLDEADRTVLGSFFPTFTYGASLGAGYRNFSLSINLMGQSGNKILNRKRGEIIWTPDGNMDADLAKNRWHGEGTSNKYPSSAGLRKAWNQKMSTYFVEDGSFFRIQNVTLSYDLGRKSVFGAQLPAAQIILTAERPLTVFSYNGFNPEVADGVDIQTYPIPAVYTVGLNLTF